MESAAIPRHSHLLILLHYGILSFRSVKEKRSRKESVATQVPWSFKSWGLHRLHLRWVSPDSLLSESLVFSVSHIKNTYSCQDLIALPDEEIRFPYYMSIFECGTTICLTRAHNDRLTIKSFAWSSKLAQVLLSVVLRDIGISMLCGTAVMNTREIDRTPLDDIFITYILAACWVTSQLVVQGSQWSIHERKRHKIQVSGINKRTRSQCWDVTQNSVKIIRFAFLSPGDIHFWNFNDATDNCISDLQRKISIRNDFAPLLFWFLLFIPWDHALFEKEH